MTWTAILGFLARFLRPLIGPVAAYFKGRADAKRRDKLDDYENAEAIRDRVERDRAQRVRELDGTGWRD